LAKKVKFNGFENHPKPNEYRGVGGEWKKGDIKTIEDDKQAEKLLSDFDKAFEVVK